MTNLLSFIADVKEKNLFPRNVQVSEWYGWTLVSCFDEKKTAFISESVAMGIDKNPEIACFKALTEYLERRLSKESADPITRLTKRTDGFAAYPVLNGNHTEARNLSRKNALFEAAERYLWATWWDNVNASYTKESLVDSVISLDIRNLITEFDLADVYEIRIEEAQGLYRLSILLAETKNGGVVSGGAASLSSDQNRFVPAFGELLRHLLALEKIGTHSSFELSFYEKRLAGFGRGEWNEVFSSRMACYGDQKIELPELIADQEIFHSSSEIIKIHRCLYSNQPVFMGGRLERLCI
jgi:hypothetical protein